jgi:hypothetical protein
MPRKLLALGLSCLAMAAAFLMAYAAHPSTSLISTRSGSNCVNCVVAVDAILSGRPASALPGGQQYISELAKALGGTQFTRVSGQTAIESQLLAAGHGARGVVYGNNGTGTLGHVFNAVNQNGTIRFLDGQTGGAASFSGFKDWYFMPYTPR